MPLTLILFFSIPQHSLKYSPTPSPPWETIILRPTQKYLIKIQFVNLLLEAMAEDS